MKTNRVTLSVMMFFQLAVLGSFLPIFSMYMKDFLGFSSTQTGYVFMVGAVPSIVAPFISSFLVDRFVTSRRYLMICHTLAAALMMILSYESSFAPFLAIYFLYNISIIPSGSLVNSIVFHAIDDSKSFGKIRVWGTIGWIVAGWIVSFLWKTQEADLALPLALRLSSLFSLFVVIIALALPKQKLTSKERIPLIPKETFAILKNKRVILMLSLIFLFAISDKFYFFGMPLFLTQLGAAQESVPRFMSLGQMSEVGMLFILGQLLKRLGFKRIFMLGMALQVGRFLIFWSNSPVWLTALGIFMHGIIFSCFFAAGTIFLDNFTGKENKSGFHQLMGMLFAGGAGMVGNFLTGHIAGIFVTEYNGINFQIFWSIPLVLGVIILILLTRLRDEPEI